MSACIRQTRAAPLPSSTTFPRITRLSMASRLPQHLAADHISSTVFAAALARYPALIQDVAAAKEEREKAKPGQSSLVELDRFRYLDAVAKFGGDTPEPMTLEHVQHLVEWKLRHGKFRPTLMKLVSSNDPATTADTVAAALTTYRREAKTAKSAPAAALAMLAKLRGIGPATASLLLSVHDPAHVVFFSDELFYWLCCDGDRAAATIKYNNKEYAALVSRASDVMARLELESTLDLERVAYVIVNGAADDSIKVDDDGSDRQFDAQRNDSEKESIKNEESAPTKEAPSSKSKRPDDEQSHPPTRRSKRLKKE